MQSRHVNIVMFGNHKNSQALRDYRESITRNQWLEIIEISDGDIKTETVKNIAGNNAWFNLTSFSGYKDSQKINKAIQEADVVIFHDTNVNDKQAVMKKMNQSHAIAIDYAEYASITGNEIPSRGLSKMPGLLEVHKKGRLQQLNKNLQHMQSNSILFYHAIKEPSSHIKRSGMLSELVFNISCLLYVNAPYFSGIVTLLPNMIRITALLNPEPEKKKSPSSSFKKRLPFGKK